MSTLRPLQDQVAVLLSAPDEMTPSGIILVPTGQKVPNRGTVIAVGPKVEDIQPGQTVVIGDYDGVAVNFNDEELVLLREKNVLAEIQD